MLSIQCLAEREHGVAHRPSGPCFTEILSGILSPSLGANPCHGGSQVSDLLLHANFNITQQVWVCKPELVSDLCCDVLGRADRRSLARGRGSEEDIKSFAIIRHSCVAQEQTSMLRRNARMLLLVLLRLLQLLEIILNCFGTYQGPPS
jgi:hypothetical protein